MKRLITETLTRLQAITQIDHESLENGEDITRATRSDNVKQDMKIKKAWQLYNTNALDIPHFLACASNILKAFRGHLIDNAEYDKLDQNNGADVDAYHIHDDYDNILIFLEMDIMEIQ
ncbi:uncharacterized protein LOC130666921 [Microplitis mediator]|uniref:uncharacterized protein LOC130666921 n=1 Tax=Microplitis mediator TaxID=375433 RepID=UPI002556E4CB|nr:uncharacterized protein LOC130666921 [Microplitis mediator]